MCFDDAPSSIGSTDRESLLLNAYTRIKAQHQHMCGSLLCNCLHLYRSLLGIPK